MAARTEAVDADRGCARGIWDECGNLRSSEVRGRGSAADAAGTVTEGCLLCLQVNTDTHRIRNNGWEGS